MRILLGAVPFGCDNVGDEAILACTVATLQEAIPQTNIGVCTSQPDATAQWLGVATHNLLGFKNGTGAAQDDAVLATYDVFIWSGATGLSDYPEVGVSLINRARALGLKVVLWCVGMNDVLNPNLYRVRKRKLARAAAKFATATRGRVDVVAAMEARKSARVRAAIGASLNSATLRVVRDPESKTELRKCGVMGEIIVGADPALWLKSRPLDQCDLPPSLLRALDGPGKKLGVCLSAQGRLQDISGVAGVLDRVIESGSVDQIVFVPMNPKTDQALGVEVRQRMRQGSRTLQLEGDRTPETVQAVIGALDAVLSSRLHAIILASNVGVPFVGIARGSKFNSFLAPYGMEPAGTVDVCDMTRVEGEVQHALRDRQAFEQKNATVRGELGARYEQAVVALRNALETTASTAAESPSATPARMVQ